MKNKIPYICITDVPGAGRLRGQTFIPKNSQCTMPCEEARNGKCLGGYKSICVRMAYHLGMIKVYEGQKAIVWGDILEPTKATKGLA